MFTNGKLGLGYYKDDTLINSEAHQLAATASEAAAAAAAVKAALDAKAAVVEAARLEAEREHARIEASLAEKAPLEALAARYAMEQEKQQRAKQAAQAEKLQRALMIEAGFSVGPEAVTVEPGGEEGGGGGGGEGDDNVEEEDGEGGEEGGEAAAAALAHKVAAWEAFNAMRAAGQGDGAAAAAAGGEPLPPLSFESWEEANKLAKKQEWWGKENERRASEGNPDQPQLSFEEWEALEAEKKKEKKRAKARERGKNGGAAVVGELSGFELAIVPGQMWATDKTGIPDHLPAAVKQKIMKKLMNEVIMRPSPEQEERLRIEALEKDKAVREQSGEYKKSVMDSLDAAVESLEAVISLSFRVVGSQ